MKQVIVEAVPKTGWAVLNADDPLVAEMRKACSGSVILFSMQEKNDLVERWVRRGRKAVVLEKSELGEMMVIREGRRTMPVAWVHTLPATFEGRARMMVQNAMAAAAAAHVAGAHLHDIRQGLRSFTTSIYQAPGRLNVFDLDGVRVLIDYAHNAAGLETLGDFVERLATDTPGGRTGEASWAANLRVGVIATAGDRRDEDMRELGRVAARYFDEVIVREDRKTRGRPRGETAELIADGRARGDGRRRRARRERRDRARRDGRGPPGARPLAARATWSCSASTTPPTSTRSSSSAARSRRRRSCRPTATASSRPRAATPTCWASDGPRPGSSRARGRARRARGPARRAHRTAARPDGRGLVRQTRR